MPYNFSPKILGIQMIPSTLNYGPLFSALETSELSEWGRTRAEHAPAVVAVAAANIENSAAFEWCNMRQHSVPLPIRVPLGIDG